MAMPLVLLLVVVTSTLPLLHLLMRQWLAVGGLSAAVLLQGVHDVISHVSNRQLVSLTGLFVSCLDRLELLLLTAYLHLAAVAHLL